MKNLPDGAAPQEPATVAQLNAAIEGLAPKDNVRVGSVSNINLAAPGATIDGVTMAVGDRFLAKDQTTTSENGIYIYQGAAVPATRAADADAADEMESAITVVDEGTNAGVSYRQTQVNFILDTDPILWTSFGSGASAASETVSGIAEIATQAETDAGTDDARFVTPLKLATSPWAVRSHAQNIGDGASTSYTVTHNLKHSRRAGSGCSQLGTV